MKNTDTPSIERLKELIERFEEAVRDAESDCHFGTVPRWHASCAERDDLRAQIFATLETAGEVERLEAAIREHCDEHGPFGDAWNVSSMLDLVRRTLTTSPPLEQPDIEGRHCNRCAEDLAPEQTLCPFCDNPSVPLSEARSLPTTEIRREALEEAAREELDCAQIAMGHGKVDVGPIHWKGRTGLLLRPRDAAIPIGDPGEVEGDYWPAQDDVVIWIDDPKGADVIMTELAPLASPPSRPSFDKWDYAREVLDMAGRVPSAPGSSSLRSPEPVPVSASGDDPSRCKWCNNSCGWYTSHSGGFARWVPCDYCNYDGIQKRDPKAPAQGGAAI